MSFSIELALQKFPKVVTLKDGAKVTLRPLRRDDEKDFHKLFLGIPEPERMFIKHRVIDLEVIRDWCRNIDYGRNLPLVALMNGKIIGDATLHQQLGGWKRHVGRVSVLVHPEFRGRTWPGRWWVRSLRLRAAPAWKKSRRNSSENRRRPSKCLPCLVSASSCDWKITSKTCRPLPMTTF